jgi:outer membrane protein assembly complex protein YaeT
VRKKIWVTLFITLICICLIFLLLHTRLVRFTILQHVLDNIEKTQGLYITVQSFDYNLLKFRFALKGVVLQSRERRQMPPFFQAEEVKIDVPLVFLLRKKMRIQNLEIENPEINLVFDARGLSNLPLQEGEKDARRKQIPEFVIERAVVKDALIQFTDKNRGVSGSLSGIWFKLKWEGLGIHSLLLELRETGSVNYGNARYPVEHCALRALFDNRGIDIKKLNVCLAKNEFRLSGRLSEFTEPFFEGRLEGDLDLESLSSQIFEKKMVTGQVQFRTHIEGPLENLSMRTDLRSGDLRFKNFEKIALDADVLWKERLLSLSSLRMEVEKGEIQGSGVLNPFNWSEGSSISLSWKSILLNRFYKRFDLPSDFGAETSGTLKVSWTALSPAGISGHADIHFEPGKKKNTASCESRLSGHILADADSGKLNISIRNLSLLEANMQGKVQLSSEAVSGEFAFETHEVERLMPFLMDAAKVQLDNFNRPDLKGHLRISGRIGGTPNMPYLKATVKSEGFTIFQKENLRMDGVVDYDFRFLRLDPLVLQDNGASIKITGFYPVQNPKQPMHFDLFWEEIPLNAVLETVDTDIEAKAWIRGNAQINGHPADPTVECSLIFSDAAFFGEELEEIELSGRYEKKEIVLESLRVKKDKGLLEAEGHYHIIKREVQAQLSASSFVLQGLKLPHLSESIRASLDFGFEAKGPLDAPRIMSKGSARMISVGVRELGDVWFQVSSAGEELEFLVRAPLFSSRAEGSLQWNEPFLLHANIDINDMSFETLKNKFFLPERQNLSGTLTSRATLKMNVQSPMETLDVKARVDRLRLIVGGHRLESLETMHVSFDSKALVIDNVVIAGTGTRVRIKGSLPLESPSASGLSINADVNLDLISQFFPNVDYKGLLRADAQVFGALSSLQVSATVDLFQGQLLARPIPVEINDIQFHLKIENNLVGIESLSFRLGNGLCKITGEIPLEAFPLELPAEFHEFEEREAKFVLNVQNLDPGVLKPFFPGEAFQSISGRIDGGMEGKGRKLLFEEISAAVSFETLELSILGMDFVQKAPAGILLERGKITVQNFDLRAGEDHFKVEGTAVEMGMKDLDFSFSGELDLNALGMFLKDSVFSGKSRFQLQITGNIADPMIQGIAEIQDAGLQMAYPRVFIGRCNGKIQIDQNRLKIQQILGDFNGGSLKLNGEVDVSGGVFTAARVSMQSENSLFDYPKDLFSHLSTDLELTSDGKHHSLSGKIAVIQARYTEHLSVESAIFQYLRRGSGLREQRKSDIFLSNLHLNIEILTVNNFLVDNNIAKSEIAANIKLIGTANNPALAGRVDIAEGGKIYFSRNTFLIERGTVDFINPNRIEPDLNLSARTQVGEYDIQLNVSGTPDRLSASLVSDPPLTEPNIISLLVTGRTVESASASVLDIAGNKALSYIDSAFTGRIEQAAAQTLGLESVRIDTGLVSAEENPNARITVGQHLTSKMELVFSQDLKDAQNRTWIVNYNPVQNINLQGVKRDNDAYNAALRHELRFGLKERPVRMDSLPRKDLVIARIDLEGQLGLPENLVKKQILLTKGKRFDFYTFQQSLDKLRTLYAKYKYLSCAIETKREEKDEKLNLIFHIDSGPKIIFEYQGAAVPPRLQKEIINTWMGISFGQMVREDIEKRLKQHFIQKRFYMAEVKSKELDGKKNEKIIVFQIFKREEFHKPVLLYTGNQALSVHKLTAFLQQNHLVTTAFIRPLTAAKSLENYYFQNGFLAAKVHPPDIEFLPPQNKVLIKFSVNEGPRFRVGQIVVRGTQFFSEDRIVKEINIQKGGILSLKEFDESRQKIRKIYMEQGFNDVNVEHSLQVHPERGLVDLIFSVGENQQGRIESVQITGNILTEDRVIQRELKFKPGDFVNYQSINETRKSLYDLGIFERVSIEAVPLEQNSSVLTKPYVVVIEVWELKPYRLRYGLQYDTESSFGVSGDFINRNLLGRAHLFGTSFRLNRDERDLRAFLRTPYFFSNKINTEFFTFAYRSVKPSFTVDRMGLTLQQQVELSKSSILTYNYIFERIRTIDPIREQDQTMDAKHYIGTFHVAFTRDTRDDILNASRGIFLSQDIGYAPGFIGTDVRFIRYFGQFFAYKKITDSLVYASGLRLGLGRGLGQELTPSQRFFAGGGTTVRGFKKDKLGPKNLQTGVPEGGDAVFVFNQELRFPVYKRLGGVVFMDLGNVYAKAADFDPFDVRKTAGFGLRFHTSLVLIRFDWGFKLGRRRGESLSQIFFSIGQAF